MLAAAEFGPLLLMSTLLGAVISLILLARIVLIPLTTLSMLRMIFLAPRAAISLQVSFVTAMVAITNGGAR